MTSTPAGSTSVTRAHWLRLRPHARQGLSPEEAWRDPDTLCRLYGESIEYSLHALISWVVNLNDDDLALVLLGDHPPLTVVTGPDSTHEVPISFAAADPAGLARIADRGRQDGPLPCPTAPVWPMDAFRDRFLDAFTTTSGAQTLRPTA